ncbi:23S rRNA (uridine(2552)-2'-O)-methyltransferase [Candidatus Bathyarchaeota archaeon]|nr:MAG: 23S rRNA (uridine(2552)-2'-O)-methyltransferase [Candidatus Bathyarchaeota archaeon]
MVWRSRGDHYYRMARARGYRSRAAFKLIEAVDRFGLIGPGDVVLDLGCAPGGWLQVAREAVGPDGLILGVDLRPVEPLGYGNVRVLQLDILSEGALEVLRTELPNGADVVLSDTAPRLTGVRELDHARQMELANRALEIALSVLRPGGRTMIKASQGPGLRALLAEVRRSFKVARLFKPRASRPESPEIYVVGLGLARSL